MKVRVCQFTEIWSNPWRRKPASLCAGVLAASVLFAIPASVAAQSPYGGNPWVIPGVIQAEDFDDGGQGVGYYDHTWGNDGGAYRSGDVDIATTPLGLYTVGWAGAGEWLQYTVNVTAAGNYTVVARVASAGSGGAFHIEFNGVDKTGSMRVPDTGSWVTYQNLSATVWLEAGVQSMRIVLDSNGSTGAVGNLHFVRFEAGDSGSGGGASSDGGATTGSGSTSGGSTSEGSTAGSVASGSSSFTGSALAIPGTIEAEDFDHGGQGVGYYDHSGGNEGGAYRSSDVDIAVTPMGLYTVGWTGVGEWLNYTVNVTAAGNYTVVARVASAGSGGTFHIEFNGADKTGSMRVPDTGGWGTYQNLPATVWLDAGVQSMRIVFDSAGSTGAIGNLHFVRFEAGSGVSVAPEPPPPPPAPESVAPAPEPPPPSPPPVQPSHSGGGGTLRVMTWNIHFGYAGGWAQAEAIANSGADVVLLQEAQTWDEHMPTTYPARLQQLTGQTWYTVWSEGDCGGCQGNLIMSKYPIISSYTVWLSGTAGTWALVDVGGVRVNVFNIHLEYDDRGKRSSQLLGFMDWTRQFGGPRIAGGDFNSWWDEWWIRQMETEYSDTWQDVTGSDEEGYTLNHAVRFDYLFRAYEGNWRLTPTSAWVNWTGLSDHGMFIADYIVR
jgi:endonuclease/exonuclease/phosphatase family metal-dependent hydrolase